MKMSHVLGDMAVEERETIFNRCGFQIRSVELEIMRVMWCDVM